MATRVHLAAVRGYLGEIVGLLQADPGLLEAEDITGGTPLIFAAMRGQVVIVRYLLEHGANVNGRDSQGRTALYVACWGRHRAVVDLLLRHGATLSIADHKGTTPLMRACSEGDVDIVRAVVKRATHTDVDAHNARGRTPLWYAVQWSRKEVVRTLLLQGADPCVDMTDHSYGADEAHHRAQVAHSCAVFLKSYVRVYLVDRARRIYDATTALHTAAQLHQQPRQPTHHSHTATLMPPPPPPPPSCVVTVPRYLATRGLCQIKGAVGGPMYGVCKKKKGGAGPTGDRARAASLSPPRPPSCTALMASRAFSCSSLVSSPSRFRLTAASSLMLSSSRSSSRSSPSSAPSSSSSAPPSSSSSSPSSPSSPSSSSSSSSTSPSPSSRLPSPASSSSSTSSSSPSQSSSSSAPLPVVEVKRPLPPRVEGCLFSRPANTQEAKRNAGQRALAAAVLQHAVQELKPELYTEMMACLGWMDV